MKGIPGTAPTAACWRSCRSVFDEGWRAVSASMQWLALMMVFAVANPLAVTAVQAATDGVAGVFEMDGNAIDATPAPGDPDDWNTIVPAPNANSDALTQVFQDGGRGGTLFTKGSKDL